MPSFDYAIRLEQREDSVPSGLHCGTIVADSGADGCGNPSQQALQTSDHRIFAGFSSHKTNMIAAREKALKTACMTIGTRRVPVFS